MQNPNHWFVVYDRGPEFRMTRWNTRTRLRLRPAISAAKPACTSS